MRKINLSLAQAKLQINKEHRDAIVKRNSLLVVYFILINVVSLGQTKAIKG